MCQEQPYHPCQCGLPLDSSGHHRAACARTGIFQGGGSLESVAARICREAGGRVTTKFMWAESVRCETFGGGGGRPPSVRRCSAACGHHHGQCSPCNGQARSKDGVALAVGHRWKERSHQELIARRARTRQVGRVGVGGRWSTETRTFLSLLAHGRARSERLLVRKRVEQAWRLQWRSLLSCSAARAVAMSLLDLPGSRGGDGELPPCLVTWSKISNMLVRICGEPV